MTMEALQGDLKEIVAEAKKLSTTLTTSGELISFVKNNLVPFIESHVAETADIDECVADMVEHAEDILQPDTAKIFAGCIQGGLAMALKLEEVLAKDASGKLADPVLAKLIADYRNLAQVGGQLLDEITMPDDEEDDEEEDDDEDDLDDDDVDESDEDEDDDETEDEGDAP